MSDLTMSANCGWENMALPTNLELPYGGVISFPCDRELDHFSVISHYGTVAMALLPTGKALYDYVNRTYPGELRYLVRWPLHQPYRMGYVMGYEVPVLTR